MVSTILIITLIELIIVIIIYRRLLSKINLNLYNSIINNEYKASLVKWLELKSNDISIYKFIEAKNIKSISIYGAGITGKLLLKEIRHKVNVNYFIDNNPAMIAEKVDGIKVVSPYTGDEFGEAIIIAVLHNEDARIKDKLEMRKINRRIYLLRDILAHLYLNQD